MLPTRQTTESPRIHPSTVTHGSRQPNRRTVSNRTAAATRPLSQTAANFPPHDRVAQRRPHVDPCRGGERRGGFDPPQTDAQPPDALGVVGAQPFELAAAQLQCFDRRCGLALLRAIAFDLRQQRVSIAFQTARLRHGDDARARPAAA